MGPGPIDLPPHPPLYSYIHLYQHPKNQKCCFRDVLGCVMLTKFGRNTIVCFFLKKKKTLRNKIRNIISFPDDY